MKKENIEKIQIDIETVNQAVSSLAHTIQEIFESEKKNEGDDYNESVIYLTMGSTIKIGLAAQMSAFRELIGKMNGNEQ